MTDEKQEEELSTIPEFPSVRIHIGKTSKTTAHADLKRRLLEQQDLFAVAMQRRYSREKNETEGTRFYMSGEAMELAMILTSKSLVSKTARLSKQLFSVLNHKDTADEIFPEAMEGRPFPLLGYMDLDIDEESEEGRNVLPAEACERELVDKAIILYIDALRECLGESFPTDVLKEDGMPFPEDLVLLRGSRKGKFSWHVVFRCFVWENNYHQSEFIKHFVVPKLNFTAPFNTYKGSRVIDYKVTYRSYATLRMWNCHHVIAQEDWDVKERCAKEGVVLDRLKLVCSAPFPDMADAELLLWTSITMGIWRPVNCSFKTSSEIIEKPFRVDREMVLSNDACGVRYNPSDVFLMKFLAILEDALVFRLNDEITGAMRTYSFGDLWPRNEIIYVKSQYKMEGSNFSFSRDKYKVKVLEVFFRSMNGTVCLSKGDNIYSFQRHRHSNISIVLKGNQTINQSCWVCHADHLIELGKMGELMAVYEANREKKRAAAAAILHWLHTAPDVQENVEGLDLLITLCFQTSDPKESYLALREHIVTISKKEPETIRGLLHGSNDIYRSFVEAMLLILRELDEENVALEPPLKQAKVDVAQLILKDDVPAKLNEGTDMNTLD
jgi:hypothetical protein